MFQENQDINVYLTPFRLPEDTFLKNGDAAMSASLDDLFHRLEAFLSARENRESALRKYISDSGMDRIIAQGFDVFKQQVQNAWENPVQDPDAIYASATACFESGKIEDAALLFALISTFGEGQAPVLSAMAACACRQTRFQNAYDLATESLSSKERHPRAYLLAGYCALKLKDHKNAKKFLALTSRIARKDPQFAPEQRCAQRELLLLQFAS